MMRTLLPVLAIAIGGACTEATPGPTGDTTPVYLALGDSVAFGYDPLIDERMAEGYPEVLSRAIGLDVTNAACPGEATGGFMSPAGNDNGCRENKLKYPLHVAYDGTQLAFALQFLRDHPGTQLVTIDIGANDVGRLAGICAGDVACLASGYVAALAAYGPNLDMILGELRKVYDGAIVGLAIYNPTPADTIIEAGIERLNLIFADRIKAHGGSVADGRIAFQAAAAAAASDPCAAGLIIKLPDGTCDVHPSPTGDQLLADTIAAAMP